MFWFNKVLDKAFLAKKKQRFTYRAQSIFNHEWHELAQIISSRAESVLPQRRLDCAKDAKAFNAKIDA